MVNSFKELRIWQEGITLAKEVYALAEQLPENERYGLRSQITRAAVSVPSNIAEGSRRRGTNDLHHFLSIALGSLAELETQLIIANEIGMLKISDCNSAAERIEAIARGIVKLQQTIKP
ncbi:MAG: diversity-generating retroelement protein bAvd family protein [Azospirillum brasilense]|nr:MAG: diversity-generating retroelement protein bAvd family protein [Azospirillum brasilense]